MKITIGSFALVGGCCLGLLAFPQTGNSQGFYLDANAGIALAENVDLHSFVVSTPGAKLKLEAGPQVRVAGGYNINPWLGVQLETGFIINRVRNLDDNGGSSSDSALTHVPLLADLVLRYDQPDCKWVPYVGVGAGGDASGIVVDHVRAPDGSIVDGSAGTVVFAWQAFAGLRYKFNDRMSVGGGYKYFSANSASWDVEDTSGDIKTGRARIHTFGVDFTFKF